MWKLYAGEKLLSTQMQKQRFNASVNTGSSPTLQHNVNSLLQEQMKGAGEKRGL